MPDLSIFRTPAPYHILTYGTLLGSIFFQSFIGGTVAFRSLPRPQFSTLQSKIFPIYFSLQTGLPLLLALTYPAPTNPLSPSFGASSSLSGVLSASNFWSVLFPIATIAITSLANLVVIGPATTNCMKERKHQETRDGKKSYDAGPHSSEMQELNKQFMWLHGASSLLNLGGYIATICYGFTLAARLS